MHESCLCIHTFLSDKPSVSCLQTLGQRRKRKYKPKIKQLFLLSTETNKSYTSHLLSDYLFQSGYKNNVQNIAKCNCQVLHSHHYSFHCHRSLWILPSVKFNSFRWPLLVYFTSVNANDIVVIENMISPAVMTMYWGICHKMWKSFGTVVSWRTISH